MAIEHRFTTTWSSLSSVSGEGACGFLDREGNLLRELRWVFFLPGVRQRIDEIVEVAPVAALAAS